MKYNTCFFLNLSKVKCFVNCWHYRVWEGEAVGRQIPFWKPQKERIWENLQQMLLPWKSSSRANARSPPPKYILRLSLWELFCHLREQARSLPRQSLQVGLDMAPPARHRSRVGATDSNWCYDVVCCTWTDQPVLQMAPK